MTTDRIAELRALLDKTVPTSSNFVAVYREWPTMVAPVVAGGGGGVGPAVVTLHPDLVAALPALLDIAAAARAFVASEDFVSDHPDDELADGERGSNDLWLRTALAALDAPPGE